MKIIKEKTTADTFGNLNIEIGAIRVTAGLWYGKHKNVDYVYL
jgi:hypothetical protein